MATKLELVEKQLLISKQETSKDKDKKREKELSFATVDSLEVEESLTQRIERAKKEYQRYAASQIDIELPVAKISIEESDKDSDIKVGKERVKVYMDTSYKDTDYHFESVTEGHAKDIYSYLNKQSLVRAKYAHGKTVSLEDTETRAKDFSNRFKSGSTNDLHLYSGFIVSDSETGDFLGLANLGSSGQKDGHAEMAFLNRPDAWSCAPTNVVEEYEAPKKLIKSYKGIATVEVHTLLQYAGQLKKKGYKIGGKELEGVNATARLDNPGSWKACAKSGMEVTGVDSNPSYGPELRYQLRRKIS